MYVYIHIYIYMWPCATSIYRGLAIHRSFLSPARGYGPGRVMIVINNDNTTTNNNNNNIINIIEGWIRHYGEVGKSGYGTSTARGDHQ